MAKKRKSSRNPKANRVLLALLLTVILAAAFFYTIGQDPLADETANNQPAQTQQQAQNSAATTAKPTEAKPTATATQTPDVGVPAAVLPRKGQLSVVMIDVGQGDSIFIQSPSGKTMLIDAGEQEAYPIIDAYLSAAHIDAIDVVVGTHPHSDHIGGLGSAIKGRSVGAVYLPKIAHNTASYEDLLKVIAKKGLKVKTAFGGKETLLPFDDALSVRILSPLKKSYDNLNNYSVVLRITYGSRSFLFTGDAEKPVEDAILQKFPQDLLQADVLKVGHHGSTTSNSVKFIAAVAPQLALISCGKGNDYGHPHKEILARLKKANAQIIRTDQGGTIAVFTDGKSLDVETAK